MKTKFEFSKENQKKLEGFLKRYPTKKAAMLPALWLVQEQEGWISPSAMETVAALLEVTPAAVFEVVTFYTMFNRAPIGRHHIQVCNSVCCCLRDSEQTVQYIEKKLGIKRGESTSDGRFHLTAVECLGSCGTAPMMQVNNDYHENLDEKRIDKILESLK